MTTHELEIFHCSLLNGETTVVRTFATHPKDPEFPRVLVQFECEQCNNCGVGVRSSTGSSWAYDWARCVHPDAQA